MKRVLLLLSVAVLLSSDRGASAFVAGPAEIVGPVQDKKLVIGFSQCTVKEPWRVEFNKRLAAHARAKYPNVRLDILDADDRTELQVAQMRSFIRRGVDAILISPKEAAGLTGVVREASEAGIPVIGTRSGSTGPPPAASYAWNKSARAPKPPTGRSVTP